MPLTAPADESYMVGHAIVYDVVYVWRGGKWVINSNVYPEKVVAIRELRDDLRPFIAGTYAPGKEYTYVARYYWATTKRWVFFGSDQNY